jgi:hypothetical protein
MRVVLEGGNAFIIEDIAEFVGGKRRSKFQTIANLFQII